jgi:pilus assembly protein CpaF
LLQQLEKELDSLCSTKDLTESIRALINHRKEKLTDGEVLTMIEEHVLHGDKTKGYTISEKDHLIKGVFHRTRKELGILHPLAEDPEVNEIMVNGPERIFVERNGKLRKWDMQFDSREELEEMIRRLAGKVHKEINELHPIVDARMSDGSRLHAVYRNVAIDGPILSIRRFPEKKINMDELVAIDTISKDAAVFLEKLVIAGYNIFISGGTSSGKTTFLNVLSNFIPKDDRIILIEDSAELQITNVENLVRMESRNANAQGKGEVTIRQLIKASLRMRPDRIIVGEVRGEEVFDMIQAMNTGHDGSLSTGHGNSPEGMLSRLEAMYLTAADFPIDAIRTQIAEAIDIIVHLGRLRDSSRKVLEIVEVTGWGQGRYQINPLYSFKQDIGLTPSGKGLCNATKWDRSVKSS